MKRRATSHQLLEFSRNRMIGSCTLIHKGFDLQHPMLTEEQVELIRNLHNASYALELCLRKEKRCILTGNTIPARKDD